MEKSSTDEIVVKNLKTVLTIVASVSLTIMAFKEMEIIVIFLNSLTFYTSSILAFYAVDPKSEDGQMRKGKIIKYYIWVLGLLFIILLLNVSINFTYFNTFMLYLLKAIIAFTAFLSPWYSYKDDQSYKPQEVINTHNKVRDKIKEDKERKTYSVRNKKIDLDRDTKEFISSTENKAKREGRRN